MCGCYNLTLSSEAIIEHFQLQRQMHFQSSYNIAPGQKILNIVELEDQSKKAVNLFWGLVPSWAKDSKNSSHLINARSETVREKPSFRSVFNHRRSLIPATGFYEWLKTDSGKHFFNCCAKQGCIATASRLLTEIFKNGYGYQKCGVQLSDIKPESLPGQMELFDFIDDDLPTENRSLMKVVDQINRRFPKAISIAATGFDKSWKPKAERVS